MIPYIVGYFLVGAFLSCSALLHQTYAQGRRIAGALFTAFFWPVLVLVAPDIFFVKDRRAEPVAVDELKASLGELREKDLNALSEEEAKALLKTKVGGDKEISYIAAWDSSAVLNAFFEEDVPPAAYYELTLARQALEEIPDAPVILFSRAAPEWYVGFSKAFLKSIVGMDAKLQGRLLKAISIISESPTVAHGDTVKPLTNELSGLWRYRVGDSRVVYFPNSTSKKVTLIFFGPRASVYRDIPDPKPYIANG